MQRTSAALILISSLLSFSFTIPAFADQFDDAYYAYQRGDYATAYQLFKPLAEKNMAAAQTYLGQMYERGQGVPMDHAEAIKWWQKAAKKGYAAAQFNLGMMYAEGKGVPLDEGEVAEWYQKAAKGGLPRAQFILGNMSDGAEAAKWYLRAAEQGYAEAQYNLGAMYSQGQGVPQDYVLAHMWFNLVASGSSDADKRGTAVQNRDVAASKMTPAQIAEAQRLAREWKPKKEKN